MAQLVASMSGVVLGGVVEVVGSNLARGKIQSNLGYPNADYPKLLGYSKTMDSPEFFLYYLLQ